MVARSWWKTVNQKRHERQHSDAGDPNDVAFDKRSLLGNVRRPDQTLGIDAAQPHLGSDRQKLQDQFVGRGVAFPRIGRHHSANDGGKPRRNARILSGRIGNVLRLMVEQLLEHRPFGIRRLAGQHVIQRAAKRINVAADIDISGILGLLG